MKHLKNWDNKTWRPLLVSLGLSVFLTITFILADYLPHYIHFTYALVSVFFAIGFLIRFGLTLDDARALGRIGRWFRGREISVAK